MKKNRYRGSYSESEKTSLPAEGGREQVEQALEAVQGKNSPKKKPKGRGVLERDPDRSR